MDMQMTPIGAARLLPISQVQVDVFSDGVIESVQQGEANPLEVLLLLKAFEKASKRILEEIRPNFVNESAKYPEKTFIFNGSSMSKTEAGTTYDFDVCNDPIYNDRFKIMEEAKKQLEERKEFLKSLKEPLNVVIDDTGELVKIIPPLKKSTSTLSVSIK